MDLSKKLFGMSRVATIFSLLPNVLCRSRPSERRDLSSLLSVRFWEYGFFDPLYMQWSSGKCQ
jgi:hypothetical protein